MPRTVGPKGRRIKGRRFEKELASLFAEHGWSRACPSPASGGLRPYGPRDSSPWPGDLSFVKPFCVEAKNDERSTAPSRGWPGEAFVRATCRAHATTVRRSKAVGQTLIGVVATRSAFTSPRFFVPEDVFLRWLSSGATPSAGKEVWVEVTPEFFFELAPSP